MTQVQGAAETAKHFTILVTPGLTVPGVLSVGYLKSKA
jgi:hypothetical protein